MGRISKNGVIVADPLHKSEADGRTHGLHLAERGAAIAESDVDETSIQGFEAERMKARTLLTGAEEKKLLRKIDWHIMPLCSLMFLLKNMDYDNISNARIMNAETPRNIMTQLGMSSNQYALLAVLYYVRLRETDRLMDESTDLVSRFRTSCSRHLPICCLSECGLRDGKRGSCLPGVSYYAVMRRARLRAAFTQHASFSASQRLVCSLESSCR